MTGREIPYWLPRPVGELDFAALILIDDELGGVGLVAYPSHGGVRLGDIGITLSFVEHVIGELDAVGGDAAQDLGPVARRVKVADGPAPLVDYGLV
jgi:hypothetical protein